ncbi:MAG: biotin-dependent carboxyltransferase family protein [Lachnospiraceae bacterium]|nr:biotin-dependent carboxyltransferase family protein [Lachnospiraceae bacterium]
MSIVVENGGMLTTVQDEGRFGYQQYGVSPSGPMDSRSFHIANILVGNDRGEGALEVTFMGPTLRFTRANVIAVTGGDLSPCLNGEPLSMYRAVAVTKGDVLSFGGMKNGCRAYIAFAGGLDVPLVMGSKSTLLRYHLGGVEGRKLEKGDEIAFCSPRASLPEMEKRWAPQEVFPTGEVVLRVITGPQDDEFTSDGLHQFFWHSGVITNEFDRMGCRLETDPIEHKGDGNINTDGISFGSIQVPTNGKPIIMLADRQSTGGYAKIGTVSSVDLPLLAQSMPGMKVRFIRISLELAQDLYIRELEMYRQLEQSLQV